MRVQGEEEEAWDRRKGGQNPPSLKYFSLHLAYKLNCKTVPLLPSLIFLFHMLPSPVHPKGFSSISSQVSLSLTKTFKNCHKWLWVFMSQSWILFEESLQEVISIHVPVLNIVRKNLYKRLSVFTSQCQILFVREGASSRSVKAFSN